MNSDEEILAFLIESGQIKNPIDDLSSKVEMEENIEVLATSSILATYKANILAMQTNLPMLVVEGSALYQVQKGGIKKFIRYIEKPIAQLNEHFLLK